MKDRGWAKAFTAIVERCGPVLLHQWVSELPNDDPVTRWLLQLQRSPGDSRAEWQLSRLASIGLDASRRFQVNLLDERRLPPMTNPQGAHWLTIYNEFCQVWSLRTTNEISESHPYRDWVLKQRAAYRGRSLPLWRLQHLRRIGFPLEAQRIADMPTNVDQANAVVAFFREHGHYSLTQTTAGAATTKWLKRFCATQGTVGAQVLPPGFNPERDLSEANRIQFEQIPNFSFDLPSKRSINAALGLTHNGFVPHHALGVPTWRQHHVAPRIQHAFSAQTICAALGAVLPGEMLFVIGDAPAALRVRAWSPGSPVDLHAEAPAGLLWEGWLQNVEDERARLVCNSAEGSRTASPPPNLPDSDRLVWPQLNVHLGYWWMDAATNIVYSVDVDVVLLDQMNRSVDLGLPGQGQRPPPDVRAHHLERDVQRQHAQARRHLCGIPEDVAPFQPHSARTLRVCRTPGAARSARVTSSLTRSPSRGAGSRVRSAPAELQDALLPQACRRWRGAQGPLPASGEGQGGAQAAHEAPG